MGQKHNKQDIPDEFICPISQNLMQDPVTLVSLTRKSIN